MSRVGKHAVKVPSSVSLTREGSKITVTGKLGTLCYTVPDCLSISDVENGVLLSPLNDEKLTRALWGTSKSILQSLVKGVCEGFSIKIDLVGVGYRASVEGENLKVELGFSHPVLIAIPKGIVVKIEKPTSFEVFGHDKQLLGSFAAKIRSYRPPEPYKGKGVLIQGEFVLRKEGKKK
jgi:large subunit ribosomal protein L6